MLILFRVCKTGILSPSNEQQRPRSLTYLAGLEWTNFAWDYYFWLICHHCSPWTYPRLCMCPWLLPQLKSGPSSSRSSHNSFVAFSTTLNDYLFSSWLLCAFSDTVNSPWWTSCVFLIVLSPTFTTLSDVYYIFK